MFREQNCVLYDNFIILLRPAFFLLDIKFRFVKVHYRSLMSALVSFDALMIEVIKCPGVRVCGARWKMGHCLYGNFSYGVEIRAFNQLPFMYIASLMALFPHQNYIFIRQQIQNTHNSQLGTTPLLNNAQL